MANAKSDKMAPDKDEEGADVLGKQIWRIVPYAKKYPKRVFTGAFANAAAAETMFAAGRDAQRIIRATSRLFDEMEKFGIEPAPAFFEASFRGFAGCHDARGAVALYRSAERAGVNLSSDAYIQLFTAAEYDPVCFAEVAEDIPTNLPYVESGASNDSVKGTSSHGDSSSSQSTSQPVAVSTSSSSLSSPLPPPQSSGATALSAWYSMLIMRHCEVAFPKSASEAALAAEADHAGEAATLAVGLLCLSLGHKFEPYAIPMLPSLVKAMADKDKKVRGRRRASNTGGLPRRRWRLSAF